MVREIEDGIEEKANMRDEDRKIDFKPCIQSSLKPVPPSLI